MMFRSVSAVVALAALAVAFAVPTHAGDHPISQVKKTFSMPVLKAKVGDTVTFKNEDEFAHNVFSLSEVQNFDLGSYKKGETRQLKLTNPGTIEVECAIHPEMKMKIEVSKRNDWLRRWRWRSPRRRSRTKRLLRCRAIRPMRP